MEDHPFSAVRDCLLNIFAAALRIGGSFSICNLRTRHAVMTWTHVSQLDGKTGSPEYWQILSAWRPVWECRVRLGKQVLELNIIITQSSPNTDMAYKDLQKIPIKSNVLRETWFTQVPIKRYILGNRSIVPPFRVRGLDHHSGSEFNGRNNKVDMRLSPSCLTVIVWIKVLRLWKYCESTLTTFMKLNCLDCLHTTNYCRTCIVHIYLYVCETCHIRIPVYISFKMPLFHYPMLHNSTCKCYLNI
jgi:hypothetical protein